MDKRLDGDLERDSTTTRTEDKRHTVVKTWAGIRMNEAVSVCGSVELKDRHGKRQVVKDVEGQVDVHSPAGPGARHENTTYMRNLCGWRLDGVSRRMRVQNMQSPGMQRSGEPGAHGGVQSTCRVIKYGYSYGAPQ